ncbi:hypothetical protein [Ornithinimicrobium avium]|uniref:hypothetical protein n=1 Tax=Ornithinimicrobium avium TaxID=2283195 RepID=UPI0013B367EE|nr:hypothetical protein [Ornithinimicrobium avium]
MGIVVIALTPGRTHMCRRTTCRTCGKTTWAGCGLHVDQVMAGVARADRCAGHTEAETAGGRRSVLDRILGRA